MLRYIVTGSTKVPDSVYMAGVAEEWVLELAELCTGTGGRLKNVL